MQWLDSAEEFIGSRKLRNQLVHEYMTSSELFLEALLAANEAFSLLIETVSRIRKQASDLELH
jgi:uncharacterized protein YutE (UPF0331/DUF86 family)